MGAIQRPFDPLHRQDVATAPVDVLPLERDQLTNPQPVLERQVDQQRVARAVAALLGGGDELVRFLAGQVLAAPRHVVDSAGAYCPAFSGRAPSHHGGGSGVIHGVRFRGRHKLFGFWLQGGQPNHRFGHC